MAPLLCTGAALLVFILKRVLWAASTRPPPPGAQAGKDLTSSHEKKSGVLWAPSTAQSGLWFHFSVILVVLPSMGVVRWLEFPVVTRWWPAAGAMSALSQPAGQRWTSCCSHEQKKTFQGHTA